MDSVEIDLIRASWADVWTDKQMVADIFYSNLFRLDPSLRSLFSEQMAIQGEKLMNMLNVVVNNLERLDALMPDVQALGRRHEAYGVRSNHYETVGAALISTLEQGLGEKFTLATRVAWSNAYQTLSEVMIDELRK